MRHHKIHAAVLLVLAGFALAACGGAERRSSSGSSGVSRDEPFVPSSGKPTRQNSEQ